MKRSVLILAFIISFSNLYSQIGIMPPAVFINPQTRSGKMTLTNSSSEPREVEISFKFGYPSSDSLGNTVMVYDDSLGEAKYSLIPYLKAFPRKMIIEAKREQTVRFLAMVPPELEDGTYWSRVSVLSKPVDRQIDTNVAEDQIKAGFSVNTELVNVVIFQKGKQTTGVEISNLNADVSDSLVTFDFDLNRKGNSPFWGNIHLLLTDDDDVIMDQQVPIALYFDAYRRFSFNKSEFKSGQYNIEVRMNNNREDIPDEHKIRYDSNIMEEGFTVE